jgi:hypothetical protein
MKNQKKIIQKIAFKKELKSALFSIREVIAGKRKEVTLEDFLESCDNVELWSKDELKQISKSIPSSLQTNDDFSEWYAMPTIP